MGTNILPLLRALAVAGQNYVQSNAGQASEARVQRALAGQAGVAVTNPDDLDKIISATGSFSTLKSRRFIRLADTSEGQRTICPIAYLDGDFSGQHPRFRIQLIIITHTRNAPDDVECLLLRFETPEGDDPAGGGKHDYYHSQICTDLRIDGPNNTFTVPNRILWQALSCPAWPVDAKTPVHLLACVIFALYGKADGVRLLRDAYGEQLEKLIDDMHFSFPEIRVVKPRDDRRKLRKKR